MKAAVLLLGGPTGSGKSAVALELADILDAEIISADARQVYRYLDIGTAKPTASDRARVPHHLLDLCEPEERYSAARFARDANAALEDIQARGKRALVVGGTGFYFKALTGGLFEAPQTDAVVLERVEAMYRNQGIQGFRTYLSAHDPLSLGSLDPNNPARLRRAVEYHMQTGRSLVRERNRFVAPDPAHRWYRVALTPGRGELDRRLAARLVWMLKQGWLQEVEHLAGHYDFSLPAFNAVGYRELYSVVQQCVSISDAQSSILLRTRQYAKRQATWFRHQGAFEAIPMESGVTAKIASGFARFAENKSA